MDPIIWSIICLVLMVVVVMVEMFTPSFGILTCLGVGLIVASVYLGFESAYGPSSGFIMLATNLACFPIAIILGMQLMKYSPMISQGVIKAGPVIDAGKQPKRELDLTGREGQTTTQLRPSGTVQVDDRRIEVVSSGSFVEVGVKVRFLKVRGMVWVVEPIEED